MLSVVKLLGRPTGSNEGFQLIHFSNVFYLSQPVKRFFCPHRVLGVPHANALNLCFPSRCSLRSWYETVHLPHRHRSPNPTREIKSILSYKYCPSVMLLNFSVQMRTGLSNLTELRAVKKLVFTFRPKANIKSTVKKCGYPGRVQPSERCFQLTKSYLIMISLWRILL